MSKTRRLHQVTTPGATGPIFQEKKMTVRTYKIADAIMDSAAAEYRDFNLSGIEAVQDYAFNAMDMVISDNEAEAILNACRSYIEHIESPDFDGQGSFAWDTIVRRPLENF